MINSFAENIADLKTAAAAKLGIGILQIIHLYLSINPLFLHYPLIITPRLINHLCFPYFFEIILMFLTLQLTPWLDQIVLLALHTHPVIKNWEKVLILRLSLHVLILLSETTDGI